MTGPTPRNAAVAGTGAALDCYRLLIDLDDRPGIVEAVAGFLGRRGGNILDLDSHSTGEPPRFYMRAEFGVAAGSLDEEEFGREFSSDLAPTFGVDCWELWPVARRKRVCVLVSKHGHCLTELLTRWHQDELSCDIDLVVSNHPDMASEAERFGVEYMYVPVEKDHKPEAEARILERIGGGRYDLLVLARYMQILSPEFLAGAGAPIINIHHSLLPAFIGANPYSRARDRGVKIIGATAHYVTEDLDAGPIIEQDVVRVTHRLDVDEMVQAGRDIERTVLSRAVRWHLEDRVAVHGNSSLVFA
jgi:formyltetrahydrofolate deformylase